jgi:hypothetical protein
VRRLSADGPQDRRVSPALAETDRGDVALSGQDVTTSHAMRTEVARAFAGIVAGFGIRVVAASRGRELGAATRRRASSVSVNKPFFACQKGSGWKGIAHD